MRRHGGTEIVTPSNTIIQYPPWLPTMTRRHVVCWRMEACMVMVMMMVMRLSEDRPRLRNNSS